MDATCLVLLLTTVTGLTPPGGGLRPAPLPPVFNTPTAGSNAPRVPSAYRHTSYQNANYQTAAPIMPSAPPVTQPVSVNGIGGPGYAPPVGAPGPANPTGCGCCPQPQHCCCCCRPCKWWKKRRCGGNGCGKGGLLHSPCDMPAHRDYYPVDHGYYYFRPYNYTMVPGQKQFAASVGEDPTNPYGPGIFPQLNESLNTSRVLTPPRTPRNPKK